MGANRSQRRAVIVIAVTVVSVVAALIFLFLAGRGALLLLFADEGARPSSSSISLPTGSEVVSEAYECASGGCWSIFEVLPPEGMTPTQLAAELGASPEAKLSTTPGTSPAACIPGDFLDPRTIHLTMEPRGARLLIHADYLTNGCES